MKHIYLATILVLFFLGIFITLFNQSTTINLPVIKDKKDILDLFAKSDAEINNLVQLAITEANHNINLIYNIKDQDRNFKNTILAFDRMQANFDIKQNVIYILTMVSPDAQLRESAQKATTILSEFALNNFFQNKKLYAALKSYAENHSNKEDLSQSDLYFIKETLKAYKKAGLEKEDSVSEAIKKLSQELTLLSLEFQKNINISNRSIKVTREGLAGLDQDFINSLKQEKPNDKNLKGSNENLYILGVDYPTYFRILEDCSCENTRKALWHEFNLRGYPANKQVLTQIANLRNQLAKLLDFDNYAHMDISDQMAGHPDKVFSFLKEISDKCQGKAQQEIDILKKDLPDSVVLEHNKFKPWDLKFALNYYKKKYLMLDENLISEYFPYEYTIDALFGIYEKFFGLRFEKFSIDGLWHKDVQALKVYKDNKFIGNLLLDLWPRD
ncbi:MAG: M3 family metallopeptidase, partial [Novosphingobium sp.]|nr:M3 family metallopeptidase [Novosphingobium sp.]